MTIKAASARIDERGCEHHGLTLNVADIIESEGFDEACRKISDAIKEKLRNEVKTYDNQSGKCQNR